MNTYQSNHNLNQSEINNLSTTQTTFKIRSLNDKNKNDPNSTNTSGFYKSTVIDDQSTLVNTPAQDRMSGSVKFKQIMQQNITNSKPIVGSVRRSSVNALNQSSMNFTSIKEKLSNQQPLNKTNAPALLRLNTNEVVTEKKLMVRPQSSQRIKQNESSIIEKEKKITNESIIKKSAVNIQKSEVILSKDKEFNDELYTQMNIKLVKQLANNKKNAQYVQFRFSFEQDSLTIMGEQLTNLTHCNLSHSIINSFRDIGTSLRNLLILNLSYSKLKDTSGLNSFPQLQELYISNNQVCDLSGVAFHENLLILDVQNNLISDSINLDYIDSLPSLNALLIKGNKLNNNLQQELLKLTDRLFIDLEANISKIDSTNLNQDQKKRVEASYFNDDMKIHVQIQKKEKMNDPTSELVEGEDEYLCGNPIKAAKLKKKQTSND